MSRGNFVNCSNAKKPKPSIVAVKVFLYPGLLFNFISISSNLILLSVKYVVSEISSEIPQDGIQLIKPLLKLGDEEIPLSCLRWHVTCLKDAM